MSAVTANVKLKVNFTDNLSGLTNIVSDENISTSFAKIHYAINDLMTGGYLTYIGKLGDGTGGTISTLPTASSSNKGNVYSVSISGTFASQAAKVGDLFISSGSAWIRIPAYDATEIKTALNLTASDVGLGNVGNFKAVSTVANQGLTTTEQSNARTNIGAGTSNFDGAFSSLTGKPTTIQGYGISDASISGSTITLGNNNVTALTSSDVVSTYSSTGTSPVNGTAVAAALNTLPEPMVFKGTVGASGATITALPTDGTANVGDTYKVITDGTYATIAAKIGDTFICETKTSNANTWVHIPSGDEPSGTVTSVATSGNGITTDQTSGGPITTSGTISLALKSTTALTTTAGNSTDTANRTYPVALDSAGNLAVNVPWSGGNTADMSYSVISNVPTFTKTIDGTTSNVFTVDTTATQNSTNPITSGAVYSLVGNINTVLESVL